MNEVEFNPEFVSRMIPKLEWGALVQAAEEVSLKGSTDFELRGVMKHYYCYYFKPS